MQVGGSFKTVTAMTANLSVMSSQLCHAYTVSDSLFLRKKQTNIFATFLSLNANSVSEMFFMQLKQTGTKHGAALSLLSLQLCVL